jgi:hypothetical protein
MSLSPALKWSLLALAGLAVAIAVAIAASELTSERIGLASEPIRAGEALAPASRERQRPEEVGDHPGRSDDPRITTASTTTSTTTTTTTPPPPATTTTSVGGDDYEGGENERESDD